MYVKNKCSGAEAYRQAFDTKAKPASVAQMVNTLLKKEAIIDYIESIRKEMRQDAKITLLDHVDMLQSIRDKAIAAEAYGPAVSAEMNRGKVSGLYVDRIELPKHKPALIIKRANGKRSSS